ncbi:MAG: hypothetical protein ACR2PL_10210 [Dehalococcoidia bacterium]
MAILIRFPTGLSSQRGQLFGERCSLYWSTFRLAITSGLNGDVYTDRVLTWMYVSPNNSPGNVAEEFHWIAASLTNPTGGQDFVQVGIAYGGNGQYYAFFFTGAAVSGICYGAGTITEAGGKKCEHPISPNQWLQFDMHVVGNTLYAGFSGFGAFVMMPVPGSPYEQGMHGTYLDSELVTVPDNSFQGPYNGHTPQSPSYYTPLKADFYEYEADYEVSGGSDFQFNCITTPQGSIFPLSGETQVTFGKIDCGDINEFVTTENGQYLWTAWRFAANYMIGGHC